MADSVSYEFLLDLLSQDELAMQVISNKNIEELADRMIELFLKSQSVGKRRAVL